VGPRRHRRARHSPNEQGFEIRLAGNLIFRAYESVFSEAKIAGLRKEKCGSLAISITDNSVAAGAVLGV